MAEYSKQLAAGFITHFYGAIDKRLEEKTKAEFLAYDVREGYDGLFVICKDDKLLYAFDKNMTPDPVTGNFYELTGRNFIITDDVFNYDETKRNDYTIYLQPDINATTSYPAGLYRFDSVESRYKLLEGYEIREEDKIKLFNNIYNTNNVLDPAFDATTLISDIKTGADKGFYDRKYVAVENKHAVECFFVAATTDPAVAEHLEFIYNDKYYKRFATDLYGYTISNDYEIIDKMYDKSSTPWTIIPGVKEKLYYLTTADRSSTTSDIKYPGLYGWNGTEYFKVTGDYDEKSILSSNTLGSESKIHTAIGGYIKNKRMAAGGTLYSSSITTDANGELIDVNITLSKQLINAFIDAGIFSPSIEVMIRFANSSKNVIVDNLRCIVYPTEKESIENSSFELNGDYSNVKVVYNTSGNYVATLNMTKENGFEANTEYTKIDIYIPYNPEYSYVNNKYLDVDETTITYKNPLDRTAGTLHAKSAIEIATFPTTGILPETIYRLTTEETISGKTYLPGEYVYDAATGWIHINCYEIIDKMYDTSGTTPVLIPGVKEKMYYLTTFQRVFISGVSISRTPGLYGWNGTDYFKINDAFDEKTIKTIPDVGAYSIPVRTAIGGYRYVNSTGGVDFSETFTTDANGAIVNQTITPTKLYMNVVVDKMNRNKPVFFVLRNATDGDKYLEGELSIYPTAAASAANSTFEVKGDNLYFKVVYTEAGEGAYSMTLNVPKEAGLTPDTTYTFSIKYTTVDYHYVNNRFIEMDNTTITDVNPLDKTIGPLHAKSAIEITTFPTTGILPETIYRLTTEVTISGKKYAPGLYVYDTTGTDPVWLSVGGSEVDEKTILSRDDAGNISPLHTAVGGYFEKGFINIKDRAGSNFSCAIDATTYDATIEATYSYKDLSFDSDCKLYVKLVWEGWAANTITSTVTYNYNTTTKKFENTSRTTDEITTSVTASGDNYIKAVIKSFTQGIPDYPDTIEFFVYKGTSIDSKTVRESDSRFVNIDNKTLIRAGKDRFDNEILRTTIGGYYDRIGDDIGHPISGIAYVDISNLNSVDYFTMFVDPYFKLTSGLEGETCGVKVHTDGKDPVYEQGTVVKVSDTEYYFDTDNYKIVLYMNAGFVDSRFYMKDSSKISANYISVSVYRIMGAAGTAGVIHSIHPKYISVDSSSIDINRTNGSLFSNGIIDEIPNTYRQNWIYRQSDPFEYGGTTYPAGIYTLKNNVLTRLDAQISADEETIITKDFETGKDVPIYTELGGRVIKSNSYKPWPDSYTLEYSEDDGIWTWQADPYGEVLPYDFTNYCDMNVFKSYVEVIITDETDPSLTCTRLLPLRFKDHLDGWDDWIDLYFSDENDLSDKFRVGLIVNADLKDKHTHTLDVYFVEPNSTRKTHTLKCSYRFYENDYLTVKHPEFIPIDDRTIKLNTSQKFDTVLPSYLTTAIGGYTEENSSMVSYTTSNVYVANTGTDPSHAGYTYYEISGALADAFITSLSNNKKAILNNLTIKQTGLMSNVYIHQTYTTNKSDTKYAWNIQIGESTSSLHPAILELYTTNVIRFYIKDDDTVIDPTIGITLYSINVKVEENSTTYHPIESKFINIDNTTLINDTTGSGETGLLRAKSAIETNKLSTITTPITETMYRLTADETIGTTTYKAGLYVYDKATSKWTAVGGGGDIAIDNLTIVKDSTTGNIKTSIGGSVVAVETPEIKVLSTTEHQVAKYTIACTIDDPDEYIRESAEIPVNMWLTLSNGTTSVTKEFTLDAEDPDEPRWTYEETYGEDYTIHIDLSNYGSNKFYFYITDKDGYDIVLEWFGLEDANTITEVKFQKTKDYIYNPIETKCIKIRSWGGLKATNDGLEVICANDSIRTSTSGLYVHVNGDGGLQTREMYGIGIKLKSSGGLSCDSNGLYLTNVYTSGTSLPTTANDGDLFFLYST